MFRTKAKRRLWLLALLIAVLAMSAACGGSRPQSAIVGKWQQVGGGETIEFYKDGTVTATSMGLPVTGNYKFVDGSHIRIELGGIWAIGGPQIFEVSIVGNRLTLKTSYLTTEYTRVK